MMSVLSKWKQAQIIYCVFGIKTKENIELMLLPVSYNPISSIWPLDCVPLCCLSACHPPLR